MKTVSQSGVRSIKNIWVKREVFSEVFMSQGSAVFFARMLFVTMLVLASIGQFFAAAEASAESIAKGGQYVRLQLKVNNQYLDADHCSSTITLNPGSDYDGGSCQLWRFVPAGGGWFRLQLKVNNQYLDAAHCSNTITLNPGSDYDGGSCQLWRPVQAGGGWFRLQLKNNGQYLDADHCSSTITLNPGSDYDGGSCQLWRLVR